MDSNHITLKYHTIYGYILHLYGYTYIHIMDELLKSLL